MSEATAQLVAAGVLAVPALVWVIIARTAWQGVRVRAGVPARIALISTYMAFHYLVSVFERLAPTDLDWRVPGLLATLGYLNGIGFGASLAVFSHRGPFWPAGGAPRRGRAWLTANYGAAALVIGALLARWFVPAPAVWLAWFFGIAVLFAYSLVVTVLFVGTMRRRARRGGWRPGALAEARSPDLALAAGGLLLLAGSAVLVLGGLETAWRWVTLGVHAALGLAFAAIPGGRILGEIARRFLFLVTVLASTAAVYLGGHALAASRPPEVARLLGLAAVLGLAVIVLPGQAWLRAGIDRLLLRRSRRRRAELEAAVHGLAPELGVVECCRRALDDLVRVLQLRGAAALLCDGTGLTHGNLDLAGVVRVWPTARLERLPARVFDADLVAEPALREALAEAEVVAIVPLATRRQRWGHLFVTTGLLAATAFVDEAEEVLQDFAARLALVLDGADLLARALHVERSLAHTEKLAAIGELAARVAHEIRNPVTAARSLAQQLAREPESPLNAEHAALILTELERVERQVAALLRFARRDEFRFEPVDVGELVRATVDEFRPRLEGAGVGVELAASSGITARADREKIRQVLINLVENAIEALAERDGGRRLVIAAGRDDGVATIRVEDNGPGVPTDALPHLFEPFFSRKPHGTGLGLAIARRTVEAHGGHIDATSGEGDGTRLRLTLPLVGPTP